MILARLGLPALLLYFLPWLHPVSSQENRYESVLDAFPELEALTSDSIFNPNSGGQDFDYCCMLAVNASYEFIDGSVQPTGLYINQSVEVLKSSQWPCGAQFTGNKSGAPEVVAPYLWVRHNCPGWQENHGSNVDDWTQLFVGFLLPAVAFCLIVPRQQELSLPRALFDVELGQVSGLLSAPFLALAAGLVVAVDTVYWLVTVFTFPGPILLSGLYEATVDKRMLAFIRDKIENGRLSRTDRSRILFAILVGNLDLSWGSQDGEEGQAWVDTQGLVADLEEAERSLLTAPVDEHAVEKLEASIKGVKVRLKTMLACQFPFGSTVGAPIVFFLGSFAYALRDLSSNLGRNASSHALAYGSFWVVMPLVSIVASCLLAGNNPNTLEGIVGRREISGPYPTFFGFVPSFDTGYKPAWMWNRGRNKQHWAEAIARRYPVDDLRERVAIRNRDWVKLSSVVLVLLFVPCALAFCVSYLTPKTGLGCRSIDFMMFFCLQVCMVGCWVWKYLENGFAGASRLPDSPSSLSASSTTAPTAEAESSEGSNDKDKETRVSSEADGDEEIGTRRPQDQEETGRHAQRKIKRRLQAWWCIVIFLAVASCFFGIGGTAMQLVGVYQNALCSIPLNDWIARESTILLSTNSRLAIELAQDTWIPLGVTGAIYLAFICYMGWWYNTYLRLQFDEYVDALDQEKVRSSTFISIKPEK